MAEGAEVDVTRWRGEAEEQEGRAMATLERKVPSPEAFLGKPWSSWIDAARVQCADNQESEDTGKESSKNREVMRLNKEDMHLFGHCPAHDEFYLVVCSHCNQVVKPQAFNGHCGLPMPHTIPRPKGQERRHGSSCKATPSPASTTSNSTTSPVSMKSKACSSHMLAGSNSKPFKSPKDNLHASNNRQAQAIFPSKVTREKPCVPVPVVSLEKIPNLVKADGTNVKMSSTTTTTTSTSSGSSSSTSSATLIKSALTATNSKPVPPSPEKILNGKAIVPPVIDKKHQNGTKSSNKSQKRLSEREFDPNRHCGVMDPETKKPCTRSLTCKTHSLNHRRAVPGRRKLFDSLLAEHKARSKEKETVKDKEHLQVSKDSNLSQPMPPQEQVSLTNPGLEHKVTSPAKSRLLNTALASRGSSIGSLNSMGTTSNSATVLELQLPIIGDLASRLSSDEGEMDGTEESEKLDCQYSGHHPRPLGYCTFGSRLMGRGFYVFDRRWDRFRLALNSMVEKHLNSQMWKKIPPAADSPMLSPAAPITTTFSASVLQPLSSPSAAYLPSSSPITPSCVMTAPVLSSAGFATAVDTNSIMSYTAAFPQAATAFNLMESGFKAPSLLSPVPMVIPSPSLSKPLKTKTSRSSKVKDLSSHSDKGSCNKRKKPPPPPPPATSPFTSSLQTSSSTSSFSGSHKRNCVLNPGTTLNSFPATSSYSAMSVHNTNNGTNALSAKIDSSGRTSLPGSSTDSIKHMSMVVSSIDPTLSVSSLVHHAGDHALAAHNAMSSLPLPFDKSEGKKRKNSGSSSRSSKITKMPGMNSVHKKSAANVMSSITESNNSVSRQIGKGSSVSLSQSSPSTTTDPVHGNRQPKVHQ